MPDEAVSLPTPDGPMDAFVARPASAGRSRAVVVVQEAYGVNDHIRDVCRRFAAEGWLAIAPEIFHREGRGVVVAYDDLPRAMERLARLDNPGIQRDLLAALAHARSRTDVDARRVALVGFCVGGFAAFLGACRLDPAATVSFYGGGIVRERPQFRLQPLLAEAGRIRAPILCLFGAEDRGIPPEDVAALRARLEALAVPHDVVVYPDAGHAFFCDARASYRSAAAADAWTRTLAWLRRHLPAAGDQAC